MREACFCGKVFGRIDGAAENEWLDTGMEIGLWLLIWKKAERKLMK